MIATEDLEMQQLLGYTKKKSALTAPMTVFCDLDGPLIDVSDRYYKTYQLGLAATQNYYLAQNTPLVLRSLSKTQFWQMKQSRTPDIEIALRSGLHGEQIEFFLTQVTQIVNQPSLLKQDKLQLGVRWSLGSLHARGVQLIAVTLRHQTEAVQVLQKFGLAHLFTTIRGTQDKLAAYRNYTECKQGLLADILAQPELVQGKEFWMIGDTEADVMSAKAMGISTIAVTCGIRSHSYLKQLQPTRIHQDLLFATHDLLGSAAFAS